MIGGSDTGDYEEFHFLGCNAEEPVCLNSADVLEKYVSSIFRVEE
jgi:hypothetical protein